MISYNLQIQGLESIAILTTILIDTGSAMDNVIFKEFKGIGNMYTGVRKRSA
ncbi:MAG: hypothetical protein ISR96_00190 [Nitrospira sp.]|nr:hypothetical protein [bacterium]MBL7047934.1 hypothetical protein [Nitrospira sp.]